MVDVVEVHTADRFEEAVQAPGKADRHAEDLVPVVEADFPLAVAVGAEASDDSRARDAKLVLLVRDKHVCRSATIFRSGL